MIRHLMLFLFSLAVSLKAQPTLEKLKIIESEGSNPIYNRENNSLLYYGKTFAEDGRYTGSTISILNFNDSSRRVLERNVAHHAIGWVDSNKVLIFKTYPNPQTPRKDTPLELFVYDLIANTKYMVDSIPLRMAMGKFLVDSSFIIYQIGVNKSAQFFKYDMVTGEKKLISEVMNRHIGYPDFCYSSAKDLFVFSEYEGDKRFKLKSISNHSIKTLAEWTSWMSNPTLDEFSNKLYFTTTRETSWYGGVYELRSYDFDSGEIKLLYTFDEDIGCHKVVSYKKDELIVELWISSEKAAYYQLPSEKNKVGIGSLVKSQLFILKI